MRTQRVLGVVAVAALLWSATVLSQAKPDLSGTWQMVSQGSAGPAFGEEFTVKHTADVLTIEVLKPRAGLTLSYKLDGTETTNSGGGANSRTWSTLSVAQWRNNRLVITTKAVGAPNPLTASQVLSVSADGRLSVEMMVSGMPAPATTIYQRKPVK